MSEKPKQNRAKIVLNPNVILAKFNQTIDPTVTSVRFGLQSLNQMEEFAEDEEVKGALMQMKSWPEDVPLSFDERKQMFASWVTKKGFESLVEGLNAALKEACLYCGVIENAVNMTTSDSFNEFFPKMNQEVMGLELPKLLERLRPHLTKELKQTQNLLSINKARACLVHSSGVVSQKYFNNPSADGLRLTFLRTSLIAVSTKDGSVTEITERNNVIADASVQLKTETKHIEFKAGEKITVDYRQFNECILTCWIFLQDLIAALPTAFPQGGRTQ